MTFSSDLIVDFTKVQDATLRDMFNAKKSFVITEVPRLSMTEVVEKLEKLIEECGMRSRVYAKGRSAGMVGVAIPTPATIAVGVSTAAFIAGHTVATFNPDYEIATNRATGTLTISYTKWESVSAAADAVGAATAKAGAEISAFGTKLKNKLF